MLLAWVCCCGVFFFLRGRGGRPRPGAFPRFPLGPSWDVRHRAEGTWARVAPGRPAPAPRRGSGAEGRGGVCVCVCKCCALAFFLPPLSSSVLARVPRGPAATVNRAWMLFT